ncbi:MAG: DUF2088 domain-containing protein [Candidatus Sericytochromatia bacterium]|uniref:DUF2088 domain-containing protein n=1 Tax=Candidatus Tanganyikabacteria bacterium TaxID=2961651 RepID=A0A938BK71_9BACT|nr:DUF2088 domain-containing protein [Candidatus Tanganyikabacteria bacterium]
MTTQVPQRVPVPLDAPLPRFLVARQRFVDDAVRDPATALAEELRRVGAERLFGPGQRIAVTAGSRGIDQIATVTRALVSWLKGRGAQPLIVPAMGSHGGATAEGQLEVLASYGLTEAALGCPVRASMEAVEVGALPSGYKVYCDRFAFESDGIILVNRVKPHTILVGELGSGLLKMLVIGLGKQVGADSIHLRGLQENFLPATRVALARVPVKLGIALVENSFDHLSRIEAVLPDGIEEADRRLLALARSYLPTIPFDPLDTLIVLRMGKNISGAGMDPNVIGMHRRLGGPPTREIGRIVALDLTEESHGNAIGVGMADVITERLRGKIDLHATAMNAVTSGFLGGVKLPLALPTDREAIALALKPYDPARARAVVVRDTSHLDTMWISEPLAKVAGAMPALVVEGPPFELRFSPGGDVIGGP